MAIKRIKSITLEEVPEAIRAMRIEAGYTQDELAKLAGTSPSVISRYEKGNRNPTVNIFQKIVEACGHYIQIL